jgi:hypothetical protein
MNWNSLSEESQKYVDRYIRTTGKTREQALREKVVQEAINEYENGKKERLVFA